MFKVATPTTTNAKSSNSGLFQKEKGEQAFIQPKLNIGKPNDKYEVEADQMADQVVAKKEESSSLFFPPAQTIQKQPEEDVQKQEDTETEIQEKSLAESITPVIQLKQTQEVQNQGEDENLIKAEDDSTEQKLKDSLGVHESITSIEGKSTPKLTDENIQEKEEEQQEEPDIQKQTSAVADSGDTSSLESNLNNSKGGGSPLANGVKQDMESGFGADFSNVRIHNDSTAVQMNKSLGSQAFTNGNDIYFNKGKYNPQSNSGKHLLAHELTHTIQQGSSIQTKKENNYLTNAKPNVQAAWYNFDIPYTDYQFDPSIRGIKNAANITADVAGDAFDWVKEKALTIFNKLKKLINKGKDWIVNKWEALKSKVSGSMDVAKTIFDLIVSFIKSPMAIISSAILSMDADTIQNSWSNVTSFVLNMWDNFHKMGMGLIKSVEKVWNTISSYADGLFSSISALKNNWLYKHLPSSLKGVIDGLIDGVRALWNTVKKGWNTVFQKLKTFIDNAFKRIRKFINQILTFAINKIIMAIVNFGKLLLFLKDFIKNPMKYLRALAGKMVGYLSGVEGHFRGQVNRYFPSEDSKEATPDAVPVIQKKPEINTKKDSASWSEIGDGILEMMGKKWEAVKKDPLSIVLNLLLDMLLPVYGNIKDVIKLFKDIKKIVMKPLGASSLEEFWTSLLHILDIPILIYNTFWSIIGRSIMLPLLIASFIPHPVVKAIAIAAGYALLAAMITGEVANIGHKILLLKTGATGDDEKKDAFNSLSDSLIAFAMEVALAIIILIVSAIANVIKGIFNFVKTKIFTPKTKSKADVDVETGKIDTPDSGKKDIDIESTRHKEGEDLTPEEIKAEFDGFGDGKLKKSNEPGYEWEIELKNGHKWKRKKNGKWCRHTTLHCFEGEMPFQNDREFYEHLKREGLVTESFEDFMKTKPNQPEPGTDISSEILDKLKEKPKGGAWDQAPEWKKWVTEKGGKVIEHADGSITYVSKNGHHVKYSKQGYPDFGNHLNHPEVKSIDLPDGFNPRRTPDYKKANELVGKPEWGDKAPDGYRWHHHQNGKTMQLVPEAIHEMFPHAGGIANL